MFEKVLYEFYIVENNSGSLFLFLRSFGLSERRKINVNYNERKLLRKII